MTDEAQTPELDFKDACAHCGGWHLRACPRVRGMKFHTNGQLAEVEFWRDGQWDTTQVFWPEDFDDVVDEQEPSDDSEPG